jgi:hypothetical protein
MAATLALPSEESYACIRRTIKITDERRAQSPDAQQLTNARATLSLARRGAHSVHRIVRHQQLSPIYVEKYNSE